MVPVNEDLQTSAPRRDGGAGHVAESAAGRLSEDRDARQGEDMPPHGHLVVEARAAGFWRRALRHPGFVVGSLLVLALLITPAAAAMQVTASPVRTLILSVLFAEASIVGGILLALAGSLPISPYVTSISFLIYVVCRVIGGVKRRHSASGRQLAEKA